MRFGSLRRRRKKRRRPAPLKAGVRRQPRRTELPVRARPLQLQDLHLLGLHPLSRPQSRRDRTDRRHPRCNCCHRHKTGIAPVAKDRSCWQRIGTASERSAAKDSRSSPLGTLAPAVRFTVIGHWTSCRGDSGMSIRVAKLGLICGLLVACGLAMRRFDE